MDAMNEVGFEMIEVNVTTIQVSLEKVRIYIKR